MKPDERTFEEAIEASLLEQGGYLKSLPSHFDPVLGLDRENAGRRNERRLDSWILATIAPVERASSCWR